MKKKTLKYFKQIFEEQKALILKQASNIIEVDIDGDEMDQIQGSVLSSVLESLSRRNVNQLYKINKALKKINDGTFGECEECGELISEKRLLAKPDVCTCIVCAERLEYIAKQYACRGTV